MYIYIYIYIHIYLVPRLRSTAEAPGMLLHLLGTSRHVVDPEWKLCLSSAHLCSGNLWFDNHTNKSFLGAGFLGALPTSLKL